MRLFKSEQYFDYPWEQVSAANWQKYPNEVSTHVKSVDVLRREYDPVKQVLTTERLIGCSQNVPRWLLCMTGGCEKSYVREISTVDLQNRTVTMRSCNLTWGNLLKVWETVVYSPDSSDPFGRTKFRQEAEITAHLTFQRVCDQIEDWSVDRFGQNAKKGKLGFDSVLENFAKLDEISDRTCKLFDEMNLRTSSVLKEWNNRTDSVLKDLNERKESAIQDVNVRTHTAVSKLADSIFHKN
ncbi:DEKNAAC102246 [Brettanomyces naardenensis]|uniref:DEKNAAC102246 n=1 Tax=Brettanomyces naardenensis TaxID=13370 RepID=A0A448YLB5_BRENA|nr:DEKNAAC102246 [Brettanomyces naardenensis]